MVGMFVAPTSKLGRLGWHPLPEKLHAALSMSGGSSSWVSLQPYYFGSNIGPLSVVHSHICSIYRAHIANQQSMVSGIPLVLGLTTRQRDPDCIWPLGLLIQVDKTTAHIILRYM